jgi:hypothetical protein
VGRLRDRCWIEHFLMISTEIAPLYIVVSKIVYSIETSRVNNTRSILQTYIIPSPERSRETLYIRDQPRSFDNSLEATRTISKTTTSMKTYCFLSYTLHHAPSSESNVLVAQPRRLRLRRPVSRPPWCDASYSSIKLCSMAVCGIQESSSGPNPFQRTR